MVIRISIYLDRFMEGYMTMKQNVKVNNLVNKIIESISTKVIDKEIEAFIHNWLLGEKITDIDREVFRQLALKRVLSFQGSNCFRGCKKIMNNEPESYSTSIETATGFAGNNGYVIAIDCERTCFFTFALNDYLAMIFIDYIYGIKPDIYPQGLIDKVEETISEEEIIVITDVESSSVFKIVNKERLI